ncbi:hypothetical protein PR202_ga17159 [Eleusine coracana subsp. coracana]|uniref:Protein kinase domain-containing protein n=1 Tax=Eleusine coracana subsp. coracana TaxID=191504 RepID=A0AAV5CQ38_ELECO|nr:hypothetical protein PR202_ga17159 [Eleusine coracana subsp. coracana]
MEARIADFGLAKTMPDEHTHFTASKVAGTLGYIAPEYHQTYKFTVDDIGLVKWLRRLMQDGDLAQAIDPAIAGQGFEEQILLVLRIAVFCTAHEPKERPTAKDVRSIAEQDPWFGCVELDDTGRRRRPQGAEAAGRFMAVQTMEPRGAAAAEATMSIASGARHGITTDGDKPGLRHCALQARRGGSEQQCEQVMPWRPSLRVAPAMRVRMRD